LLVFYSSEARGYGLVQLFAVAAFYLLEFASEKKGIIPAVLYAICTVLGLLSHATYLYFFLAALLYSILKIRHAVNDRIKDLIKWQTIPVLSAIAFYMIHVRHINYGGGPPYSTLEVIASTASLVLGGPEFGGWATAMALVAAALIMASLIFMAFERPDQFVFYLVVIGGPIAVALSHPELLFVRYFFLAVVFSCILISHLFALILCRYGASGKSVVGIVLVAILVANGSNIARFLQFGRGDYLATLRFMAENTQGPEIVIGSDHDFRNSTMLRFYARYLPSGKRVHYLLTNEWPPSGPEWIIFHDMSRNRQVPESFGSHGIRYELSTTADFFGLSGWRWFVYHKDLAPKDSRI
jgi:hypothetical protein